MTLPEGTTAQDLIERLYDELEMVLDYVLDDPEKPEVRAADPLVVGFVVDQVEKAFVATLEDVDRLEAENAELQRSNADLRRKVEGHRRTLAQADAAIDAAKEKALLAARSTPSERKRLDRDRDGLTMSIHMRWPNGEPFEADVTINRYPDGRPAEIFVDAIKEGSFPSGMLDAFAIAVSIGLQHGVPLRVFADKFRNTRFSPEGFTDNPGIPRVTSVLDYVVRAWERLFPAEFKDEASRSA